MAFCGNCGTKAVGEFCVNCGKPTQLQTQAVAQPEPVIAPAPPVVEVPVAQPEPVVEQVIEPEPEVIAEPIKPAKVAEAPVDSSVEVEAEQLEESLEEEESDYPRRPSKRLALILGGSIIALGALLFPGSGELTVVYQDNTTDDNKAVDLTLQIDGQDIRVPKDADGELIYTGTWSSFEPSVLKVIPDPVNDEVITIAMPQFGSLGIWNLNKPRVVTITANDRSLDVNLNGADNFSEVGTASAYRTFYSRDLSSCKEDFNDEFGYGINLRRNAYDNYLAFVEDSQLDGQRTLQYTTWASRADNLQAKMGNYLSLASANPMGTKNAGLNTAGDQVQDAIISLQSAWKNLESVSRAQSDSKWDAAWTRIYNAETALFDKTEAFKPTAKGAGGKICDAQLNRE
jgi:hypothetical protein